MKANSKQITVSKNTHSLLFIVCGQLQSIKGASVGLDETIRTLITFYDHSLTKKLEVKE